MKEVIQQVLSADVSKRSEIRVSEFEFDCLSIFFSATESCISIQRIALTSEFKKEKQQQLDSLLLFVWDFLSKPTYHCIEIAVLSDSLSKSFPSF